VAGPLFLEVFAWAPTRVGRGGKVGMTGSVARSVDATQTLVWRYLPESSLSSSVQEGALAGYNASSSSSESSVLPSSSSELRS
jgi:hypothetical protein